MELIQLRPCNDGFGEDIIVKALPTGTRVSAARRPGIAPDHPIIMQLVERTATGYNRDRLRIVVQWLPARTRVSAARRPGIAPDHAIIVQLVERTASGYNCHRVRIVI